MASRTSRGRGGGSSVRRLPLLLAVIGVVLFGLSSAAAAPGPPPAGLTGISLAGQVGLSWSATAGATGYSVYRGTTATSITTQVDTGRRSGGHVVHRHECRERHDVLLRGPLDHGRHRVGKLVDGPDTPDRACVLDAATSWCSRTATRAPRRGTSATPATIAAGGIEGFGTAPSIDKGQSVDLKVNSDDAATFRIEIYRMGYYGGAGARLFSTIRGVPGTRQPGCITDNNTGLIDCSNWSVSATLTTTAAWPSGVYHAAARARGHRHGQPDPAHRARRRAPVADLLYGVADHELPGLQQLRRQVALRLQLVRRHDRRRHRRGRSRSRSTGRTSSRAPVCATGTRATRPRPSTGSSARATTCRTPRTTDLERNGARRAGPQGVHLAARTTSTGRPACARRSKTARDAGVNLFFTRLERDLLEDPLRGQPRRVRHGPRRGLLQVDPERRRRPERHPDRHVARPGRREPARRTR